MDGRESRLQGRFAGAAQVLESRGKVTLDLEPAIASTNMTFAQAGTPTSPTVNAFVGFGALFGIGALIANQTNPGQKNDGRKNPAQPFYVRGAASSLSSRPGSTRLSRSQREVGSSRAIRACAACPPRACAGHTPVTPRKSRLDCHLVKTESAQRTEPCRKLHAI